MGTSRRADGVVPGRSLLLVAVWVINLCGCSASEPDSGYAPGPSKFDRAWAAALGAAHDVGVVVSSADRSTGIIDGSEGGDTVRIVVRAQADGSVGVEINARSGTAGRSTDLAERLSRAYDRRMGR